MSWYIMAKKDLTAKKRYWTKEPQKSEEDSIYEAGKLAAHQNKCKHDNPYPKKDPEHDIWNNGFDIVS